MEQPVTRRRADPSPWQPAGSAGGSSGAVATLSASAAHGAGATAPQLAPGVERLGKYRGSGLTEATYLVRNSRGQVVQQSRLPYLVLSEIDGSRTVGEIADRVSVAFGRTVSVGNVEYLLANKLAPAGLLATGETARLGTQAAGQAPAILALKAHRTLVPARAVQRIAGLLQPLFRPFVVVTVLACLIAADAWLLGWVGSTRLSSALRHVLLHPLLLLLVFGLVVLSGLFHECGHAAACRYGGARPGVIGMGVYLIWPAFYTNVTDAYRLGRAGRIRTDLGGVYFNTVYILPLAAAYLATGYQPLLAAIVLIHMEIIQQLLPSLRFDGYFILADLIGVPDLFRRITPTLRSVIPGWPADPRVRGLKRSTRVVLTAWVLLIVLLLACQLAFILLNAPSLTKTSSQSLQAQVHSVVGQFGQANVPAGLVAVISLLLAVLVPVGLCYILLLTGRRTLRRAVVASRRHPALRYPFVAAAFLVAAGLAAYWGILPLEGDGTTTALVALLLLVPLMGGTLLLYAIAGGRPGMRQFSGRSKTTTMTTYGEKHYGGKHYKLGDRQSGAVARHARREPRLATAFLSLTIIAGVAAFGYTELRSTGSTTRLAVVAAPSAAPPTISSPPASPTCQDNVVHFVHDVRTEVDPEGEELGAVNDAALTQLGHSVLREPSILETTRLLSFQRQRFIQAASTWLCH